MTRDEAIRLLGLSSDLSPKAVEDAFARKSAEAARQADAAPTPALGEAYRRLGERLRAAKAELRPDESAGPLAPIAMPRPLTVQSASPRPDPTPARDPAVEASDEIACPEAIDPESEDGSDPCWAAPPLLDPLVVPIPAPPPAAGPSFPRPPDEDRRDLPDQPKLEASSNAADSPRSLLNPGQVLASGRYEVRRVLGEGRAGRLYEAFDRDRSILVALRVLSPSALATPEARLISEERIRSASMVNHKEFARVYGRFRDGPLDVVALELMRGRTFAQEADRRKAEGRGFSAAEVFDLGLALSRALAAAHRWSPHGRIGPSEIWLAPHGAWKVAGMVEAAVLIDSPPGDEQGPYTAPERCPGTPPTPAEDQYAVGAILYHAAVGEPPGAAAALPPGSGRGLGRRAFAAINRALSPDPLGRFSDMAAFEAALSARKPAAHAVPWVAGGLAACVVGLGLMIQFGDIRRWYASVFAPRSATPVASAGAQRGVVVKSGATGPSMATAQASLIPREDYERKLAAVNDAYRRAKLLEEEVSASTGRPATTSTKVEIASEAKTRRRETSARLATLWARREDLPKGWPADAMNRIDVASTLATSADYRKAVAELEKAIEFLDGPIIWHEHALGVLEAALSDRDELRDRLRTLTNPPAELVGLPDLLVSRAEQLLLNPKAPLPQATSPSAPLLGAIQVRGATRRAVELSRRIKDFVPSRADLDRRLVDADRALFGKNFKEAGDLYEEAAKLARGWIEDLFVRIANLSNGAASAAERGDVDAAIAGYRALAALPAVTPAEWPALVVSRVPVVRTAGPSAYPRLEFDPGSASTPDVLLGDSAAYLKARTLASLALSDLLRRRAASGLARGEFDLAESDLVAALKLEGGDAEAHHLLGQVRQGRGNRREAVVEYDAALGLIRRPAFLVSRGAAFEALGEPDRAADDYREAISIDPAHAPAHLRLGDLWFRKGDFGAALAAYSRAVESAPDDPRPLLIRAELLRRNRLFSKGLDDLLAARKLAPRSDVVAVALAELFGSWGKPKEALEEYTTAIRLGTRSPRAFLGRGALLLKDGEDYAALKDYDRAIELDRNDPDAYEGRARAHEKVQSTAAAREDLERSRVLRDARAAAKPK